MSDEQILELAKTCAIFNVGDDCWECFEEDLLKFARAIYSISWKECIDRWNYWENEMLGD